MSNANRSDSDTPPVGFDTQLPVAHPVNPCRPLDPLSSWSFGIDLADGESRSVHHDFGGYITLPVVSKFGDQSPIGFLSIRRDALPISPDFHFAIGYHAKAADQQTGICADYELRELAIVHNALKAQSA